MTDASDFQVRQGTQDEHVVKEVLVDNCYRLPEKFPDGAVVLDVGAHIGAFAHACLSRGAATVICYEPDPDNYKLLLQNLDRWDDRVVAFNAAVWRSDYPGQTVPFLEGARTSGRATAIGMVAMGGRGLKEVAAMPFDLALEHAATFDAKDHKVALLKLDCEGSEYPLVYSSRQLPNLVKDIVGETHTVDEDNLPYEMFVAGTDDEYTHKGFAEALMRRGFHCETEYNQERDNRNTLFFATRAAPRKPATVLFMRFPYGYAENPDAVDWLVQTMCKADKDPRVKDPVTGWVADTPITMTRNAAVERAKEVDADLLVMLDSDMKPDLEVRGAVPFWDTAFDFWWNHAGPCVVGAPYCGPPPNENSYVFRWRTRRNSPPDPEMKLDAYTREESADMHGVRRCAALPTGLIAIDVKGFDLLDPPYFYYEFYDVTCQRKASTEDVVLTRDMDFAGVPLYCAWDSWAGHWKRHLVGRPSPVQLTSVPLQFRNRVEKDVKRGKDVMKVKPCATIMV